MPDAQQSRSLALDALRGLAILGMGLSGRMPWGSLPNWMYHAQFPPPEMKFNDKVYGITWVDLVFPFFLFAMGAAMPFAIGRRLNSDLESWRIALDLVKRGALLALFAIAAQHFRPETMEPQWGLDAFHLGLITFGAMVLAWGSWPKYWANGLRLSLNGIGAAAVIALAITLTFKGNPTWDWARSDIILLVLANVAISGGLAWMFTRNTPHVRAWIIVFVAAMFLAKSSPGVVQTLWKWSPVTWLYQAEFHKYLLIVLPGTYAGEWLRDWMAREDRKLPVRDRVVMSGVGTALSVVCCYGLLNRQMEWTWIAAAILCAVGLLAVYGHGKELTSLAIAGTVILFLGLVVEPIGGGIRKDSATLSYFFVTAGLAFWVILGLLALEPTREAAWWQPNRLFIGFFAGAGANPMIAYIAITNFIPGLVRVTGIHGWANSQPWDPWGFAGYGLFMTILVGFTAILCTRARIFMKA